MEGTVKSSKTPDQKYLLVRKASEPSQIRLKAVSRAFSHLAGMVAFTYRLASERFPSVSLPQASTSTICARRETASRERCSTKRINSCQKCFCGSRFSSSRGWYWLSFLHPPFLHQEDEKFYVFVSKETFLLDDRRQLRVTWTKSSSHTRTVFWKGSFISQRKSPFDYYCGGETNHLSC